MDFSTYFFIQVVLINLDIVYTSSPAYWAKFYKWMILIFCRYLVMSAQSQSIKYYIFIVYIQFYPFRFIIHQIFVIISNMQLMIVAVRRIIYICVRLQTFISSFRIASFITIK